MRYNLDTALEEAKKLVRAAARWKDAAFTSSPGAVWHCNACTYATADLARAEQHAITQAAVWPFAHILYERFGDEKPRRRLHSPDGQTARLMQR